jgi:TolA-binding protein
MWFMKTTVRLLVLLLATQMAISFGANREIVQLQRDIALLHDDMRSLETSLDQSLGGFRVIAQQTLDRVNQIHTAAAIRNDNIAENWEKLNLTVAALNTKLNQNVTEYLATRDAMADLSARLARLEQRLADIGNSVTALQNAQPSVSVSEVFGVPPPGTTAESLFQSALGDKLAGRLDLALDEFQQYLRYYGNTELAAGSQFYIGEIHYHRGDLLLADEALTAVIERYPKSGKAADALLMRALLREKQGELAAARTDLGRVLERYRGSDAARRASPELKRLHRSTRTAKARSPAFDSQ